MTKNNQTIAWHNNTVVFVKANDSIPFMSGGFMGYSSQVYFRNQSKFQLMEPEFDINLSNCFIIEMELVYSEYYAPLAAYRSGVYQVVVLDQELNPIMLCFEWQNMVS